MSIFRTISKLFGTEANSTEANSKPEKRKPTYTGGDRVKLESPVKEPGLQLNAGVYTVVGVGPKEYTLEDAQQKKHTLPIAYVDHNFKGAGSSWDSVKDFKERPREP